MVNKQKENNMPVKSTKARTSSKDVKVTAVDTSALEKKVAVLEGLVAKLQKDLEAQCKKSVKEHAKLESFCDACAKEHKELAARIAEDSNDSGISGLSARVDNLSRRLDRVSPRRR
jgi:C4-type Zn-finger protein